MNSTRVRRRGIAGRRRTLVAFVLAAAMLVAACSGGSGSDTSTTSTTTTTAPPPSTTEAEAAPEEPPQVEWIVQVGGPDNDALLGVAAREDEVVSAGYTEGSLQGEGSGGAKRRGCPSLGGFHGGDF